MWDLPGPGLEPVSPALAGGFLTTAPPGKPSFILDINNCSPPPLPPHHSCWKFTYVVILLRKLLLTFTIFSYLVFIFIFPSFGFLLVCIVVVAAAAVVAS